VATASAYAHQQPSVLPTAKSVAGICHADQDPAEFATLSDTSPAVPCNGPHQTETAFQLPLTGALARQSSRPNPELLDATYAQKCTDYVRIRKFLGARAPDVYWGLDALARFPTAPEWSAGTRLLVCDLYDDTVAGPRLTEDLAGVLTRRNSAAFRQCRLGPTIVTCDQVHNEEATSPNAILPAGPWPGPAAEAAQAVHACTPIVDAYLAGSISSRPGLSIAPSPLTPQQWRSGARSVNCWIATPAPSTGTVRGGLR
jgi:hypothetical protein